MQALEAVHKRKVEAIQDQHKMAMEREAYVFDLAKEMRAEEKAEVEAQFRMSESVSPAVAEAFSSEMTDPNEQAEFISKLAERIGVDPLTLWSDVVKAMRESDEAAQKGVKFATDIMATKALIEQRLAAADRSRELASRGGGGGDDDFDDDGDFEFGASGAGGQGANIGNVTQRLKVGTARINRLKNEGMAEEDIREVEQALASGFTIDQVIASDFAKSLSLKATQLLQRYTKKVK